MKPAKVGAYRRRLLEPHREAVLALVTEKPHRSAGEPQAELAALGIPVNQETVRTFLHAKGLGFKKAAFATGQDRPDAAAR